MELDPELYEFLDSIFYKLKSIEEKLDKIEVILHDQDSKRS
jgi:hypothetical protein